MSGWCARADNQRKRRKGGGSMKRKVDQSWFNAKSVKYETPDNIYEPLNREFTAA